MSTRVLIFVMLLLAARVVSAEQGCAPGFFPGGMQPGGPICVPIPGYGTTNNTTSTGDSVWSSRWGAIALGGGVDGVDVAGVSEGLSSSRKAKRAALEDCKSDGGSDCRIIVSYTNQCVALATGPGGTSHGRAASVTRAEVLAMEACSSSSTGRCEVIYSACSMPEQIR